MNNNVTDITSLIDLFKFGYEGNILDLIYLFLILRFFIGPLIWIIFKKIKGVIFDD